MKCFILILAAATLLSYRASAQGYSGDGFSQGVQAAQREDARRAQAEREAAAQRAQAEREAAAQRAEQERQRQAYDLQIRNQQESQRMQSQAHAEELKKQDVQIRRSQWDRLIEDIRKKADALWNIALSDANNKDYSDQTHLAARRAMIRLGEQQKGIYTFTPNFEDQESFRAGISQLPSPELGYSAEYSAAYLKREAKKAHKSLSH